MLWKGEIHPTRAPEETLESRGIPCLFLNTERGFGGKPRKKSGFVGILRGQKCLKRRFSRRSPVGEWSRGARSMPRVFGRGSRSQPAALVSDRDDAALFPAIRILDRYGSGHDIRGEKYTGLYVVPIAIDQQVGRLRYTLYARASSAVEAVSRRRRR